MLTWPVYNVGIQLGNYGDSSLDHKTSYEHLTFIYIMVKLKLRIEFYITVL